MMDERYILMIHQHLRGELSPPDQAALEAWLEEAPENREAFRSIEKSWKISRQYRTEYVPDLERGLQALRARIAADKLDAPVRTMRTARGNPYLFYGIAAGLLILIAALTVWNFWFRPPPTLLVVTNLNEQRTISLSDGSVVTLNENSSLRYPESFHQERLVELEGEAFFDIRSHSGEPFVVSTSKTRTEVVGTQFNVRAYREEDFTEVEVVEGIVRLGTRSDEQIVELQQGSRGTFRHDRETITSDHPKALNASFWKERRLRFQHHELREAILEINRRLDLRIELRNDALATCPLTLGIPIQHPDTLVAILADTYGASWNRIAPNHYTIKGGHCAGD